MAHSSRVCHRASRAATSAVVHKDSVQRALELICQNKYSRLEIFTAETIGSEGGPTTPSPLRSPPGPGRHRRVGAPCGNVLNMATSRITLFANVPNYTSPITSIERLDQLLAAVSEGGELVLAQSQGRRVA